ncbi:hypothetical protein KL942_004027 [Ogataea angusta]|nr:hypothetical protein KL942_004027 [Ogataea angusta]
MSPNRQYLMSPMDYVESPTPKDRFPSSSPTLLSGQRLPQTVPVPKPRILAEMIPETELFQKPDGGTTITPHLSRAKRSREAEIVTAMRKIENDQDYFYTKLKQIMEPPSRQESPLPELSQLMDNQGSYLLDQIYRSLDLYGSPSNCTDDVMIVKHFFTRLLPSVSSSYNPLWPGAAIQYCDKDIVRSCFVSLGALHLAGWVSDTGAKRKLLEKGALNINNTLDYLLRFIQDNNIHKSLMNSNFQPNDASTNILSSKKSVFFVCFMLYIQVLYGILENGRSGLSRVFFKLFAQLVEHSTFNVAQELGQANKTLCVSMAWWDTVSALVSPDCRTPYCNPRWYNLDKDIEDQSGCPGQLFVCMSKLCHLRNGIKHNKLLGTEIRKLYCELRTELSDYRMYVSYNLQPPKECKYSDKSYYLMRLKIAQCWSLAILTKLLSTVRPHKEHQSIIDHIGWEFADVYSSLDKSLPLVAHMIWPVMQIACEYKDFITYLKGIEGVFNSSSFSMVVNLANTVWSSGESLDDILAGKTWLAAGIDLLPL